MLRPGSGIFAGAVRLESGAWHAAATAIGARPQFYEDGPELIEAHLLDFDGDLYGQAVTLVLIDRLRAEQRFDSTEQLVDQIARDVDATRRTFGAFASEPDALLAFTSGQRR
jgi:riboflavin kinase/FMN adenylyltransferase